MSAGATPPLGGLPLPTRAATRRELMVVSLVAAIVFSFGCYFAEGGLGTARPWGDVNQYEKYGRLMLDGHVPYDDYYVEYPPGAFPVFIAPALVTDDPSGYLSAFKWLMAAAYLVVLAACAWSLYLLRAGRSQVVLALGLVALTPALLGHVFLNRYDSWPAALVAIGFALLLAGSVRSAAGFLAGGFATKILAISTVPVVALRVWRTQGLKALIGAAAAFTIVTLVFFLPFVAVAPGGVGFSLWTQARRHLHTESLGGSVLLVVDRLGVHDAHIILGNPGSVDLAGTLAQSVAALSTVVELAAVLVVLALYWRRPESVRALTAAFAATAVGFTVFAKVISPQFLVWLVPLVPLVAGRRGRVATVLLGVALALTQVEQRGWEGLTVTGWAVWALFARNVLLVAVFALLMRELSSPDPPDEVRPVVRDL